MTDATEPGPLTGYDQPDGLLVPCLGLVGVYSVLFAGLLFLVGQE